VRVFAIAGAVACRRCRVFSTAVPRLRNLMQGSVHRHIQFQDAAASSAFTTATARRAAAFSGVHTTMRM
jgi:hypothetical protein